MTTARRLAVGFAVGGAITLLAHPASRGLMTYVLSGDDVRRVIEFNPFCQEPLELFPPSADNMTSSEAYLTAYRIARRLNHFTTAGADDLRVAIAFADRSGEREADNAYWPQLAAALCLKRGDFQGASERWTEAVAKGNWQTGESAEAVNLRNTMDAADGLSLGWHGVLALTYRLDEPAHFISGAVKPFATGTLRQRYDTLLNGGIILRATETLTSGARAARLMETAIFHGTKPEEHREDAAARSRFNAEIGAKLGGPAFATARAELQRLESWQSVKAPGAKAAERAFDRLCTETVLEATLPSALIAASVALGLAAVVGFAALQASLAGFHLDRRIALALSIVLGALVFWRTGSKLALAWFAGLGLFASMKVPYAADVPPPQPRCHWVIGIALAGLALIMFTAWFIAHSTPSAYLSHSAWPVDRASFGLVGTMVLSLSLPIGALRARISGGPVLQCFGDILGSGCAWAAICGLLLAIGSTPLCIYRDGQNRAFVDSWLHNEKETFSLSHP